MNKKCVRCSSTWIYFILEIENSRQYFCRDCEYLWWEQVEPQKEEEKTIAQYQMNEQIELNLTCEEIEKVLTYLEVKRGGCIHFLQLSRFVVFPEIVQQREIHETEKEDLDFLIACIEGRQSEKLSFPKAHYQLLLKHLGIGDLTKFLPEPSLEKITNRDMGKKN